MSLLEFYEKVMHARPGRRPYDLTAQIPMQDPLEALCVSAIFGKSLLTRPQKLGTPSTPEKGRQRRS